jgi:hypothetical protein
MTSGLKEFAIQACLAQEDLYLQKAAEANETGADDLRDELLKWAEERRMAMKFFEEQEWS